MYEIAARIESDVGPVDILINNAAIINSKDFLKTNDEQMDRLIDINVKSVFWVYNFALSPNFLGILELFRIPI